VQDKITEVLEANIILFESWRDGIFKKIGVSWGEEPPAIKAARKLLKEIKEGG